MSESDFLPSGYFQPGALMYIAGLPGSDASRGLILKRFSLISRGFHLHHAPADDWPYQA